MKFFAHILAGQLGAPVSDETNLDGQFQFTLPYTPEDAPGDAADPSVLCRSRARARFSQHSRNNLG